MQVSQYSTIRVDFENEGHIFKGDAIVDRFEDDRIYGRMKDGRTFMCMPSDVAEVYETVCDEVLHRAFEGWLITQEFYPILLANKGHALFIRDGSEYRYMPVRVGFAAYRLMYRKADKDALKNSAYQLDHLG